MMMPTKSKTLDDVLLRHRQEAERLRDEHGDPIEFLGRIVRDSFDPEFLEQAYRDLNQGASVYDDADER